MTNATVIDDELTVNDLSEDVAVESLAIVQPLSRRSSAVQRHFVIFQQEVGRSMVERDDEIMLLICALLCNEHILLVGDPGTGKSQLSNTMATFVLGHFFGLLLTKYTTPEEVFGPLDLMALKQSKYERNLTGKAIEADILFLDEIFKASSAILNTVLTLLNERQFRNGLNVIDAPLKMAIGASNEWPGEGGTGQELTALFDRFLFRKTVKPIASERNIEKLLFGNLPSPNITPIIAQDLATAQQDVANIPWTKEAWRTFAMIRREIRADGVVVGDRRLKKSVRACQAWAYMSGHSQVESEDLSVLAHVLWVDPVEQPARVAQVVYRQAAPAMLEVNGYLAEAEEVFQSVNHNDPGSMTSAVKKIDEIGRKLAALKGDSAEDAKKHVDSLNKDIRKAYLAVIDKS